MIGVLVLWRQTESRRSGLVFSALAILYVFRCVQSALHTLEGGVLYKTDHPSFMFRLSEFAESFPALGGYSPAWNGGVEQFTGVSSGIQGIGLLFLPLLKIFPVHDLYNGMVLFLFLGLLPLLAFLSVKWVVGGWKPRRSRRC